MPGVFINAVQRFLACFGVRIARIPTHIEPVMPFDVLELATAKLAAELGDNFYFVQIGANDGILNDFLRPLIQKYHLKGCLVEPMEDVYHLLQRNYAGQPGLEFRNILIGEVDGKSEIYRFKRDATVPQEFFHGLARQDGEYIRRRAKEVCLEEAVEIVSCEMQTFATFAAGLPVDRIDLLYVDTEGSDDKIVIAALEAGFHPFIINYEWSEMSLERRYALKRRLLDYGYRFIDVGADTVCLHTEN